MEYSTIYESYRNDRVSFENTLRLIGDLIQERLNPEYRRVWVQASNSGRVRVCITVFSNSGYRMFFQEYSNFRNWRGNAENIGTEIVNIENIIESLRSSVLSGIIS